MAWLGEIRTVPVRSLSDSRVQGELFVRNPGYGNLIFPVKKSVIGIFPYFFPHLC